MAHSDAPIIEFKNIGKHYGNISALRGVSLGVRQGEVTCILGDNGAGKSTLISIVAGLFGHDEGEYLVDGQPRHFSSPREALDLGIAAVYQTLALVPLLPVWRNFFLGSELVRGKGLFSRLDTAEMMAKTQDELHRMGIDLEDLEQPVGTLSGGQRQVVAIARAVHFGARVLILDEPTAALGVAQSGLVLRYIKQAAREQEIGVIFITHNPHHAMLVGDHFMVLARGEVELDTPRADLTLERLTFHMAGGNGLRSLEHEIRGSGAGAPSAESSSPGTNH
jgi:simple sugar transport system ATP-binding protein